MLIYLALLFQLITNANSKLCCDHEFRIEREYCGPLASVFEFKVLNSKRSVDLIEYNVEVIKTYRGHFQLHTRSVLQATRHYCVPEIKLYTGWKYLAITNSLRVSAFTVDNCFFEQIQSAYPKVRDNQLLCWPLNASKTSFHISFNTLMLSYAFLYLLNRFVTFNC